MVDEDLLSRVRNLLVERRVKITYRGVASEGNEGVCTQVFQLLPNTNHFQVRLEDGTQWLLVLTTMNDYSITGRVGTDSEKVIHIEILA